MKKNNIRFATGLMVLMAITSCKKLDLYPYNAIEVSQAFKTVKDAGTWDVGNYASFRARQYGVYMFSSDVQGDQLNAGLDFGNRNGDPHRWDSSWNSDDGTVATVWTGYYNSIANINVAIAGFKTITPASSAETTLLNQYTGDAYLSRAYYYHNLVLRYCKAYEPATAATDLGVPLLLTYDLNALPARATLQAVYNQIIADITAAESLLAGIPGAQGSKIFTIDAARALEARVRLDMHDYAGAYSAANTLITSGKYPLITSQTAFTSYWATDGAQESIMQLAVSTTELPLTNSIYLGLITATGKYDPDFVPTQSIVDLYSATDIRKAAYFSQKALTVNNTQFTNIYLVNKYPGNPALFTSTFTNYANAPKTFRIAEMYCIAAEAAASLSTPNEVNALLALNALATARGLTPVVATGPALVQAIRDERTRELAFEGFHLDDLKRWHLGFTRGTPQNTSLIYTGANYNLLSEPADAPKYTWALPTNDITVNRNLVQNPGY